VLRYARFNFYNSVLVPDQNGDGLSELLTVCGGNIKAAPYDESDRYPGVLMLFNSQNGEIIAADTMPDGKESYMSPICFSQPGSRGHYILFGSGGETLPGHLYMARLEDLIKRDLSSATILAEEAGHGFIAPPALADLNGDGQYDIMAISHASTIFAIDGANLTVLWKQKIDNTECSNSFALGHFNGDGTPDLFTFVSKGQWPHSTGSVEVMLNGLNGNIEYIDSIGCTGFSSPVVYDLNEDGRDEVIISINDFDCSRGYVDSLPLDIENRLIAIDFTRNRVSPIDQLARFKNIFTTPWIGDLDKDRYLDIVYCQYFSPNSNLLAFLGMRVKRISTHIRMRKPVIWGAYMGSGGDGIFPLNR
jgi:hypothetical protein